MVKDAQGPDPAGLPDFLGGSGPEQSVPDAAGSASAEDLAGAAGLAAQATSAQHFLTQAINIAQDAASAAMNAIVTDQPVGDEPLSREVCYEGRIWDVVSESFTMPGQDTALVRDFIDHPGAVGILALDEQDRVLLQRQRRQPVHAELWEIPAGLLDVQGESALAAAQRELFEEADLKASRWDVLVDQYNSPGSSSEAIRVFLARDLEEIPEDERFTRGEEEADMSHVWFELDKAVSAVLAGRVGNPTAISGVLALAAMKERDFEGLRPADAEWPARPQAGGRR